MKYFLLFIKKYYLSIFMFVLIFYLSTSSTPSAFPSLQKIKHIDKLVHFVLYAALTLALVIEVKAYSQLNKIILTVLLPIIYGGIIECVQGLFFSFRSADFLDFLANSLGVLSTYFLSERILRVYLFRKLLTYINKI